MEFKKCAKCRCVCQSIIEKCPECGGSSFISLENNKIHHEETKNEIEACGSYGLGFALGFFLGILGFLISLINNGKENGKTIVGVVIGVAVNAILTVILILC